MAKLLIIEDEPRMVSGLRDNFEYEGYEVITAEDGSEGLKRALSEVPDLILLDVMLPKISGFDVCLNLRVPNKTPFLASTDWVTLKTANSLAWLIDSGYVLQP